MTAARRSTVAIVDTWMTEAFPSGKCARAVASALAQDHDVTVFSLAFEDSTAGRARFVRLRAIPWPNLVLLPTFWLAAGVTFLWRRLRGRRHDVIVAVEGYSPVATIRYAHYCHAVHTSHVRPAPGFRGVVQRIAHLLLLASERFAYRHPRAVVAVSDGLADDLRSAYPHLADRIVIIPNFIDAPALVPPADHDRDAARRELGVDPDDRVLVFVALGHFERKGLPEVLGAVAGVPEGHGRPLSLIVVGGFAGRLREMRAQAEQAGVGDRVHFVGMIDDPRPFYWMADAFVLPSRYETFSLVAFEAAAAGLPLVATPVYGVRDILVDGVTGWQVEATTASVRAALTDVAAADAGELRARGAKAQAAAVRYGREGFEQRWRDLIADVLDG